MKTLRVYATVLVDLSTHPIELHDAVEAGLQAWAAINEAKLLSVTVVPEISPVIEPGLGVRELGGSEE